MTIQALTNTLDVAIKAIQTKFTDNVYTKSALMDRLFTNRQTDAGDPIEIPHKWSKGDNAGWRDKDDTFTYAKSDTVKAPALTWARIYATDFVSADDTELENQRKVIKLLAVALEGLEKEVRDKTSDALFTGTGAESPPKIVGFQTICSSTATYALIDRTSASHAEWRSNHTESVGAMQKGNLDDEVDRVTLNGERPDLMITTKSIVSDMANSWASPRQMYVAKSNPQISFEGVNYRGIPVLIDEKMPSGNLYVLNSPYLHMYTPTGGQLFPIERFPDESEYAGVRLRIRQTLQLVCREPKLQTRMSGITSVHTN